MRDSRIDEESEESCHYNTNILNLIKPFEIVK